MPPLGGIFSNFRWPFDLCKWSFWAADSSKLFNEINNRISNNGRVMGCLTVGSPANQRLGLPVRNGAKIDDVEPLVQRGHLWLIGEIIVAIRRDFRQIAIKP